jgi:diguanylate cyclase (GGDEF)-like protein
MNTTGTECMSDTQRLSNTQRMSATQRLSVTQRMSFLRSDSIRNRILVFAVLATVLPSLATAWFSYLENKRSLSAKASEEILNVSAQAAREADLWIKERRYDLRVFASSYEVTDNLERIPQSGGVAARSGRPHQRLTDYLKSVHERFVDYDELLILDKGGLVVASSRAQPGAVVLPSDWQAQMRSDHLVLGEPYRNVAEKRTEILISVPIGVAGGVFLGGITARVSLKSLGETLKHFAPGATGQVYLMKEDGSLIVSSRESPTAAAMLQHSREATLSHLENEGGTVAFTNLMGEEVLGSVRRIHGLDWVVVAEMPFAEVFSQLGRLRNITLLIVAAMLAVTGFLGYALGMFIVRPLDRLTRGAAKVASGDLDVDLPIATGGEVGYLTEVFNNMVARLRASRSELERLSVTDHLTGLNNRRRMMEALENEVRRSRRLKHTFTVLMADVDHFKQYNDAHGHPAGDEALKHVGALLCEVTQDVDFVARYGGEEFFILMPGLKASGAATVGEVIRSHLAQQRFGGRLITLSIGVAEFPAHADSAEALIAAADAALYEAKRAGRDRVAVARVYGPVRAAER